MQVVDNYTSFGGRLYNLFKEKSRDFDLKNKRNAMQKILSDMITNGFITIEEKGSWRRQISNDVKYNFPCPNIYTSTLKVYCDYLDCSADYLMGLTDFKEVQNKAGLTDKAINRLATNKEYRFMTNALLERKGVEYLVQAVEFDCYHEAQHKRISDFMYKTNGKGTVLEKNVNLPGVTLKDFEIYHSNVKSGYQGQREALAITYLDEIENDRKIYKYFKEKADKQIKQQEEEEVAADQGKSPP